MQAQYEQSRLLGRLCSMWSFKDTRFFPYSVLLPSVSNYTATAELPPLLCAICKYLVTWLSLTARQCVSITTEERENECWSSPSNLHNSFHVGTFYIITTYICIHKQQAKKMRINIGHWFPSTAEVQRCQRYNKGGHPIFVLILILHFSVIFALGFVFIFLFSTMEKLKYTEMYREELIIFPICDYSVSLTIRSLFFYFI